MVSLSLIGLDLPAPDSPTASSPADFHSWMLPGPLVLWAVVLWNLAWVPRPPSSERADSPIARSFPLSQPAHLATALETGLASLVTYLSLPPGLQVLPPQVDLSW